jgi:acetyl esterase/lipase
VLGLGGGDEAMIRELPDRAYVAPGDPKQALDLFLPVEPDSAGQGVGQSGVAGSGRPIAVFVHGGVWAMGDRKGYAQVGRALAAGGAVAAVLSYRLAPAHPHPAQIEDVAAAVAWLSNHAREHGADPRRIVLIGHSAGAQLVSLLALDPRWLVAHGLDRGAIAGVASLSGIYDLSASFGDPGQDTGKDYLERVFGPPGPVWRDASPIHHLAPGDSTPPFLLAVAERDYAGIRTQTETMLAALRATRIPVEYHDLPARDHDELIWKIGSEGDSLTTLLREFIAR